MPISRAKPIAGGNTVLTRASNFSRPSPDGAALALTTGAGDFSAALVAEALAELAAELLARAGASADASRVIAVMMVPFSVPVVAPTDIVKP
jgi:hypothetical protein